MTSITTRNHLDEWGVLIVKDAMSQGGASMGHSGSRQSVRLVEDHPDLAQFASDMAQLGPMSARDLAIQYLDQNLADGQDFDEAVGRFIPTCSYYADEGS